jgi:hypothetical protein
MTTVGDFAEESTTHGRTWFWSQIASTLGAHIVHDFNEAPLRLLSGAALTIVSSIAAYLVLAISIARLSVVWLNIYYAFGGGSFEGPIPGMLPVFVVCVVTAHIAFGVCMARLSRHPLPLWVVWSVLCTLLWIAFSIATHRFASYPVTSLLLILIGVIWQRRLSLRTA